MHDCLRGPAYSICQSHRELGAREVATWLNHVEYERSAISFRLVLLPFRHNRPPNPMAWCHRSRKAFVTCRQSKCRPGPAYRAAIGSGIEGSSFSGLLTRVEIGHIREHRSEFSPASRRRPCRAPSSRISPKSARLPCHRVRGRIRRLFRSPTGPTQSAI